MVRQPRTRAFHAAIDPALARHFDDEQAAAKNRPSSTTSRAAKGWSASASSSIATAAAAASNDGAGRNGRARVGTRQPRTVGHAGAASMDKGKGRQRQQQRVPAILTMADPADSPTMARRQPQPQSALPARMQGQQTRELDASGQADISDTILDPDTTMFDTPGPSTSPLVTKSRPQSALSAALLSEERRTQSARQSSARARLQQEEERRTLYGSKRRRLERQERREAQRQSSSAPHTDPTALRRWQPPWPAEPAPSAAAEMSRRVDLAEATHAPDDEEEPRIADPDVFHGDGGNDAQDLQIVPDELQAASPAPVAVGSSEAHRQDVLENVDQRELSQASDEPSPPQSSTRRDTQDGYLADGSASLSSSVTFAQLASSAGDADKSSTESHSLEALMKQHEASGLPSSHILLVPDFASLSPSRSSLARSEQASNSTGVADSQALLNAFIPPTQADTPGKAMRRVRAVIWRGNEAIQSYFSTGKEATFFCPKAAPPSRADVRDWLAGEG